MMKSTNIENSASIQSKEHYILLDAYALVGLFLPLFRKVSNKGLLITSAFFYYCRLDWRVDMAYAHLQEKNKNI